MKGKTKTLITVATWQKTTIRKSSPPMMAWCQRCAANVPMVSADEAARISNTTPRMIYRRIETGDLHFTETEGGRLLVCRGSLSVSNQ
jgi:hypothetical protein